MSLIVCKDEVIKNKIACYLACYGYAENLCETNLLQYKLLQVLMETRHSNLQNNKWKVKIDKYTLLI